MTVYVGDKVRLDCTEQTILLGQEFAADVADAWKTFEPVRLTGWNMQRENEDERNKTEGPQTRDEQSR